MKKHQYIIAGNWQAKENGTVETVRISPASMKIVTDPDRCSGCRLCEMVCTLRQEGEVIPSLSRIRINSDSLSGKDVNITLCHQCRAPNCLLACPLDAIQVDERTGARIVNEERCTGCGLCVQECHLGEIWLNKANRKAYKCDLCRGEPECVKFCPQKALSISSILQSGDGDSICDMDG